MCSAPTIEKKNDKLNANATVCANCTLYSIVVDINSHKEKNRKY